MSGGIRILPLVMAVVCFALGLGVGACFFSSTELAGDRRRRAESAGQEGQLADLQTRNEELEEENSALLDRIQNLETPLAELGREIDPTPDPVEKTGGIDPESGDLEREGLALAYGDYGELDALLEADWERVAEGLDLIAEDLVALARIFDEGGQPDPEMSLRIAKENQKLRDFALQVIGQLPTNNRGNGEFTHPVAQSNLLAEVLGRGGVPLSDRQKGFIASHGEDYDVEWQRVTDTYTEATSRLEKLMDEAELKQSFIERVQDSLTADQLSSVFRPETEGRVGLDLFSPGVMLNHTGKPLTVRSAQQLKPALMKRVSGLLGVKPADLASHGAVFDTWVTDVEDLISEPVRVRRLGSYRVDDGLVAGRAQLRALEALGDSLDLSDEARARLIDNPTFFVPRLTSPD